MIDFRLVVTNPTSTSLSVKGVLAHTPIAVDQAGARIIPADNIEITDCSTGIVPATGTWRSSCSLRLPMNGRYVLKVKVNSGPRSWWLDYQWLPDDVTRLKIGQKQCESFLSPADCHCQTSDAGKQCLDERECDAYCLADRVVEFANSRCTPKPKVRCASPLMVGYQVGHFSAQRVLMESHTIIPQGALNDDPRVVPIVQVVSHFD